MTCEISPKGARGPADDPRDVMRSTESNRTTYLLDEPGIGLDRTSLLCHGRLVGATGRFGLHERPRDRILGPRLVYRVPRRIYSRTGAESGCSIPAPPSAAKVMHLAQRKPDHGFKGSHCVVCRFSLLSTSGPRPHRPLRAPAKVASWHVGWIDQHA